MKTNSKKGNQLRLRISLIILLSSLCYTFFLNTINIESIKKQNPENLQQNARSLVYNSTVYSIDNYWYLSQFKNLLKHGSFTVDPNKQFYEVRRTPVYPTFYGIHYWLFGEESSFYYIRFTQAFILALAVVALFWAVYNFTSDYSIAALSASLYGLFPPIVIAVYYTVTESLSTELVCFMIYFLSLCKTKGSNRDWFLAGLFFSLATLCRPSIIFAGAACFFALISFSKFSLQYIISKGIYFAAAAALLFIPWTVRNYTKTNGDIVFLEKYYGDPMDYGMPNIQCRQWIACWINPADFTSEEISNTMIGNINSKNPADKNEIIKSFTNRLPARAYIGNTKEEINNAFISLYNYYVHKSQPDSFKVDSLEKVSVHSFLNLKTNFIAASWKDYYIITPLLMVKSVVLQSNSGTLVFLDNYEQSFPKKAVKAILLLLSLFSFCSVFLVFFAGKEFRDIAVMTFLFTAFNMLIIILTIRYFEVRYNYPIYPFLFTTSGIVMIRLKNRLLNLRK